MSHPRSPNLRDWTSVRKGVCLLLASVLLWSDGGTAFASKNLWSERRRAVRLAQGDSSSSVHDARREKLAAAFPTIAKGSPLPTPVPLGQGNLPDWLGSTVGLNADVGEFYPPTRGDRRVLIHIQDLHDVEEAQRNTAAVLEQLASSLGGKEGLLVGLEGAAGGFRTADFRALASPPLLRLAARRLLKAGLISGPETFSLETEKPVRLWGAEDTLSYEANIRALTDTFPDQAADDMRLTQARSNVEKLKGRHYPSDLKKLDEMRSRYEEGRIGLVEYVRVLSDGVPTEFVGATLRRFREVVAQEDDLSFSLVAGEQARLLEYLAPRLSEAETKQLVDFGVAHRWGRMSFPRFYGVLKGLCAKHGLDLGNFPHFAAYAAYAEKAEGLNPAHLLKEVEAFADRRFQSLLSSPLLVSLAALSADVSLMDKLNRFVLTPEDFQLLGSRSEDVRRWRERGEALDTERSMRWPDLSPVMDRHEKFYRLAEARNRPLVLNMLPLWTADTPAVLVAGGYHAEGVRQVALAQGLGYISLLPRLSSTDHLPPPLDSFRRDEERTEWVFRGERSALHNRLKTADPSFSFLNTVSATIVGVGVLDVLGSPDSSQSEIALRLGPLLSRLAEALSAFNLTMKGELQSFKRDSRGEATVGATLSVASPGNEVPTVNRITVIGPPEDTQKNGNITVRRASPSIFAVLFYPTVGWFSETWENVAAVGSRLSDRMKQSTQNAAVLLVGPLQRVGMFLRMGLLVDLGKNWDQRLRLARERKYLYAMVLTLPPGVRKIRLAQLAENHSVELAETWAADLRASVQSLAESDILPNVPLVVRGFHSDPGGLTVEAIMGSRPVTIVYHVSNAIVLQENPNSESLFQMKRAPEGTFHVWIQLPVVSKAALFLPRVIPRVLRTVAFLAAGDSVEEADHKAILSLDERKNERDLQLNRMVPRLLGLDNQIIPPPHPLAVGVPADLETLLRQWLRTPGISLGFAARKGEVAQFLGKPYDLGFADALLASPSDLASEDTLLVSLEQQIAILNRFREFFEIRQDASWPWSAQKDRFIQIYSELGIQFLSFVGSEQGRRAAFARKGGDEGSLDLLYHSLGTDIEDRFIPLAQTVLNLWSLSGVQFNKSDGAPVEKLVSNMLGVYVDGFLSSYLPVSPVASSLDLVVSENPGQANQLAGGVFYFKASDIESDPLGVISRYFMKHENPAFCRMILISHDDRTLEDVRTALSSRLEKDFKGSDRFRLALETLRQSNALSLVRANDVRGGGGISMAAVLDRAQSVWGESVGMVDVVSDHPETFKFDDRGAMSWALYRVVKGNLVDLVARSLADMKMKEAIKTFVSQQA